MTGTPTVSKPVFFPRLLADLGRGGAELDRSEIAGLLAEFAEIPAMRGDRPGLVWARAETRDQRLVLAAGDYRRPGIGDLPEPVGPEAAAAHIDAWLHEAETRRREPIRTVTVHWSVPADVVSIQIPARCRACRARLNHHR